MEQKALITLAFKMTIALGVVLVFFAAALWAARKFSGSSKGFLNRKSTNKPLEILAFQSLGQGKNLYLVRCHDKRILLGATNTQITHIADMPEEELDLGTEIKFSGTLSEKIKEESTPHNSVYSNKREIARI